MSKIAVFIAPLLLGQVAFAADVDLKQPPPQVATKTVTAPSDLPAGTTVKLTNVRSALADGEVFGKMGQGWFCSSNAQPLRYVKITTEVVQRDLTRAFNDRVEAMGLKAPEVTGSAFDQAPSDNAEFRMGVTIEALNFQACISGSEMDGGMYAKLKWELYSVRRQKVVWSTEAEGSYATADKVPGIDFNKRMWLSAVNNAIASPGFFDALRGNDDAQAAATQPPIAFASGQTAAGNVKDGGDKFLQAVVTVLSGPGSGSGFYIGQEGLILTNQHVVGEAKFVKVKLFDGRSLVGEVVRVDKARDVALVRTDPVTTAALALRADDPGVGEDVYALGSPYGDVLSGTLTHGVLSSRRVMEGVAYLQSDASVNPGNSGGPLVDASGHVVGLTVMGLKGAQGINMFVPIGEALTRLNLNPKAAAK